MSIKIFKKQLRQSLPVLTPLLCLAIVIIFIKILIFLHTSKNQFNPVSHALKNALRIEGHELTRYDPADLENKLIAVTGRLYADNTLNEPTSLTCKQFVVLERQEKQYIRRSQGGFKKKWRFNKYHFDFCKAATLDGYSFSLPAIIVFFNMPSDVDNKPPIYIKADPQNSLSSPGLGDILYTFTRGIRSASKVTLLGKFDDNKFVPYELKTIYNGTYQTYTFFHLSVGTFDDLIKGLAQTHDNQLERDKMGVWLFLYIMLAIPYWLLFKKMWPASSLSQDNRKWNYRRRRPLSFRGLMFFITLGIPTTFVLWVYLELIKLF